jgi:MYXO-CTERM domain-containing protein
VAALLGAAPADAAGLVSVTNPTTDRKAPDGGTAAARTDTAEYYISFEDCLSDVQLNFPVSISGDKTGFQVWASVSTDCTIGTNRTMAGSTCVQFGYSYPPGGDVVISSRALVKKMFNVGADCVADSALGTAPQPVNIYFMLAPDLGDVDASHVFTWKNTQVDLLGPAAPTGVTLGVGDSELKLNLPANTDSDTLGYYVFYADASATSATTTSGATTSSSGTTSASSSTTSASSSTAASSSGGGAGGAGAGGAGGTTTSGGTTTTASGTGGAGGAGGAAAKGPNACDSTETIPGLDVNHPDIYSPFVFGSSLSASSTVVTVDKLTNGTRYRVAIAAFDEVNNIGPLSVLQCGTPDQTDTFFHQYCADGGNGCGGCGSCAVGGDDSPVWPALGTGALAALGLVLRRRHATRSKRPESA